MYSRKLTTLLRPYQNMFKTFDRDSNSLKIRTRRGFSSDVLVIGGGAVGSSVAYWLKWLKSKCGSQKTINVTVVEKDPTYAKSSTCLSVGGIRQQFSLPENIQMSLFGAEFIRTIKQRFGPEADVSYVPNGYLVLASDQGASQLGDNFKLQQQLGAKNELLSKHQLKERFGWLNVDDVEVGCLGGRNEGWFDPWAMLSLLKSGAVSMGVEFVHGEVVDFVFGSNKSPDGVVVELGNRKRKTIRFDQCVISAGAESGYVARLAGIGGGCGDLSVVLPVERRKRYVYKFDSQGIEAPKSHTPLLIDQTGVYFRRDGSSYIGGLSPKREDEPETSNLDVDFQFFDSQVWPLLAHRVPAFESIKLQSGWAGFYEYNTFDANGIIGAHPRHRNLYFATGFSGHGIQQSPAAGLAIAELILEGGFRTIDLSRMGFERLVTQKAVYEIGIY